MLSIKRNFLIVLKGKACQRGIEWKHEKHKNNANYLDASYTSPVTFHFCQTRIWTQIGKSFVNSIFFSGVQFIHRPKWRCMQITVWHFKITSMQLKCHTTHFNGQSISFALIFTYSPCFCKNIAFNFSAYIISFGVNGNSIKSWQN